MFKTVTIQDDRGQKVPLWSEQRGASRGGAPPPIITARIKQALRGREHNIARQPISIRNGLYELALVLILVCLSLVQVLIFDIPFHAAEVSIVVVTVIGSLSADLARRRLAGSILNTLRSAGH